MKSEDVKGSDHRSEAEMVAENAGGEAAPRVPRGRCLPSIPPTPDSRRGTMLEAKSVAAEYSETPGQEKKKKAARRIVVVAEGRVGQREPKPEWRKGYVNFKHRINSSTFLPLIVVLAICGVAVHVVGVTGVSLGYFKWSVECEGVVTVGDDPERANGQQTYEIGWARYQGAGPTVASETSTITNGTLDTDLGLGGIAGSSIAEHDWLASIDVFTAAVGGVSVVVHLTGVLSHARTLWLVAVVLLRSRFRRKHGVFVAISRTSASLLVLLAGVAGLGFYLVVREGFRTQVLSILADEGFLCEGNSELRASFSCIATGLGCAVSTLTALLTWRLGRAADLALTERFERGPPMTNLSDVYAGP